MGALRLFSPPIVEAFLSVRLDGVQEKVAQEALAAGLKSLLPHQEPIRVVAWTLHFGPETTTELEQPEEGVRFSSDDGRKVVQFMHNDLGVSIRAPYREWQELTDLLDLAWEALQPQMPGLAIQRIATRFVNRIDLPAGRRVSDTFVHAPPIPEHEPLGLREWFDRVHASTSDGFGILAQRSLPVLAPEGFLGALLDIEVYREIKVRATQNEPVSTLLADTLERLHQIKNEQFRQSLTSVALARYGYDDQS